MRAHGRVVVSDKAEMPSTRTRRPLPLCLTGFGARGPLHGRRQRGSRLVSKSAFRPHGSVHHLLAYMLEGLDHGDFSKRLVKEMVNLFDESEEVASIGLMFTLKAPERKLEPPPPRSMQGRPGRGPRGPAFFRC